MVTRRAICAFLCLVLPPAALEAQRFSFKHYDQQSGLENQDIRALLQDRAGFLWVGTENGLYRYDGRRFRAFTEAEGLPSPRVEAIHETSDGTLWVGTRAGLARLNGDRFQTVDLSPAHDANSIASDSLGRLYIGTSAGLLAALSPVASGQKPIFLLYKSGSQNSQGVQGIAVSDSGPVWYGCGLQLCRLQGGRVESPTDAGVPDDDWHTVAIDSHGNVWARSLTKLIELPKGGSKFLRRDEGLPEAASDGRLLLGRDGQLWVPTIRGLARRTETGWDIIGKSRGLPMSSVGCAYEDREGSIWIGLNGTGLVRWLGFPHWEMWTEAEGLSSENVWGLERDRAGVLWSAGDTGISRFEEGRSQWEDLKVRGLLPSQTAIVRSASDGSLWAGQRTGAVHIDLAKHVATIYGRESGLDNPVITSITVDPDNRVWIGTRAGLYREFRGGAIRFERQELPFERKPDFIYASLLDRKGRFWVATWNGLLRLEGGLWTRLTTKDGLLNDHVQYLAEGKDGSLWIGYFESVGLSQLISGGDAPRWRHFSSKDGLLSDKGFFVGCDLRGWIWFGTDKGVEVFDGRSWHHFDQTDGLVGADNAFWADADGSVWLGTSKGISHLRVPSSGLPARPSDAPARLTSVVFGNRSLSLDGGMSVPWSQRSLHVGFTAMTFVNEDNVRFRYRIVGLDQGWTETPLREAHFSSLPAGHYTFEVQANSRQGGWYGAPARLPFTVRPAWWLTWWFILSALAGTGILSRQLWKWRLRTILTRQKELEDAVSDRTRNLELEKAGAERERDTVARQKLEIERLFQESQQAARLKDEFLANMSHEIRTPMTAIIGMTDLVLETPLAAEQREHLQIVGGSAESLLSIINDILDLSKIEAGKFALEAVVFEPRELVNAALKIVALRAREKRLELVSQVDPRIPQNLVGDPLRLRQVLINLLGNAVKFTERGQVALRLDLDEDTENPLLRFEIADTGIGISPEQHAYIFEPFAQTDGSHSRRYGGTGLGLTVCARFVQMMEGRIWVESEVGKGSRFQFTARVRRAPEPAGREALIEVPGPELPSFIPLSILLADDNRINQTLAMRLLQTRGHTVVGASNGTEAVAAYTRQAFDAVLMDVQMPEMDGFEATAQIRALERQTGTRIPIIAFTSHAMRGDRERCLQAGMDDYVSKPIKAADLFATVEGQASAARASQKTRQ